MSDKVSATDQVRLGPLYHGRVSVLGNVTKALGKERSTGVREVRWIQARSGGKGLERCVQVRRAQIRHTTVGTSVVEAD